MNRRPQVRVCVVAAIRFVRSKFSLLMRHADVDNDGELTFDDGHAAYAKLVPVVQRHTALTGGLVGGFVTAYSALR